MIFFLLHFSQQNFNFFSKFSTNQSKFSDIQYFKQPNLGNFSYFCKYLGTIERKNPNKNNKTNKNITNSKIHIAHQQIPHFYTSKALNNEINYDSIDKEGHLYLKHRKLSNECKLSKNMHLYEEEVDDDEPAVIKKLTIRHENNTNCITGLYAPPGEVITVRISQNDLTKSGTFSMTIGQVIQIPTNQENSKNRFKSNTFLISPKTQTAEKEGDDYLFYIGSFHGGPITVKALNSVTIKLTISGAVRYPHFILGHTTKDEFEWNMKSSVQYIDVLNMNGISIYSGTRKNLNINSYQDFFDFAINSDK